jgi:GntR family transcriptional regulator
MIDFRLDTHSGVPAYLQVVHQVKHALRLGWLQPGDQLPTVKEVVGQLAINANTVLKAYRDLEREGLVDGRIGVGTFVRARPPGPDPRTQAALQRSLNHWLRTALDAGLDAESVESLFRAGLRSALVEGVA